MSEYEQLTYDVVVVGGGPAGTAAAVAAARTGAKTLVVEQLGYLGGMASAGMVVPHFEAERCGVSLDIVDRLTEMAGWGSKNWEISYDPELWKIASEQIVTEAGADILYHASLLDIVKTGNTIEQVVFHAKSGPIRVHCRFVIDATGDGDVAYKADVPYEKGSPDSGKMQPMTMMFRLDGVTYEQFNETQLYQDVMEAKRRTGASYTLPYDRPWVIGLPTEGHVCLMLSHIFDVDGTNAWDLTKAEIEGRKQAYEAWSFLKAHVPGFERSTLVMTAPHIGIRETRRFRGDYVLNRHDIESNVKFDDVICLSKFPIDIHEQNGTQTNIRIKQPYDIPFRSLLPVGCDNLLLSGRNISGTYEAHASYRVKGVVMGLGQAAGTAAGLAARNGSTLRALDISALQARLQDEGVNLGRDGDRNARSYRNFPVGCELYEKN